MLSTTATAQPHRDPRLSAARMKLAEALTALWTLEDELHVPSEKTIRALKPRPTREGQTSMARAQDDSLMSAFQRAQLGGPGATCLDWGTAGKTVGAWELRQTDFKNCAVVYDFEYSRERRLFDTTRHKIVGDLKDLSFVPAGLFDLIICSAVFEHVPQFWRAARSLSHLAKAGATLIFGVPFWYPTHFNPGDFWRFTFQGASYLLESNGFAVCQAFADGERSAQLGALGLTHGEVPVSLLHRGSLAGLTQCPHSHGIQHAALTASRALGVLQARSTGPTPRGCSTAHSTRWWRLRGTNARAHTSHRSRATS